MKILLDECISKRLKKYLEDFEVFTISELKVLGIKIGKLLRFCVDNRFDILLTIDKNMRFQQNIEKYPLSVVILNSFSSKVEELIEFLPNFRIMLPEIEKYKIYTLNKQD